MVAFRQWIIQNSKEMRYEAMKRHRENFNAYYSVKKGNLKTLHNL